MGLRQLMTASGSPRRGFEFTTASSTENSGALAEIGAEADLAQLVAVEAAAANDHDNPPGARRTGG